MKVRSEVTLTQTLLAFMFHMKMLDLQVVGILNASGGQEGGITFKGNDKKMQFCDSAS